MSRHFGGAQRFGDRKRLILLVSGSFLVAFVGLSALLLFSGSSTATSAPVPVEKAPEVDTLTVLIPVRQIQTGEPLDPTMFRSETRPKVGLSDKVLKDLEETKGMYARSVINPDQPLNADLVTNIRPTNAITANIPEGYRAVTIRVDVTSGVEGWARPGAAVDVVWASAIRGKQAVTVIVQNAKVLSAERQMENNQAQGASVPSTVTLLVTADDAAKIQLASTAGSLTLSLRGDNDDRGQQVKSITIDDLYGGANGAGQTTKPDPAIGSAGTVRIGGEDFYFKDGKLIPKNGGEAR